jgi:hypothetical protein
MREWLAGGMLKLRSGILKPRSGVAGKPGP